MKIIFGIIFLFTINFCSAQEENMSPPKESETIYSVVEVMPQFPGGDDSLTAYLKNNFHYPAPKNDDLRGNAYVSFVVDHNGDVRDVKILRGVRPELDEECIRVVKAMPKWEPGTQNGRKVNVQYNLPLNFHPK